MIATQSRTAVRTAITCLIFVAPFAFADEPAKRYKYSIDRDVVYAKPEGDELLLDAYVPKSDQPVPAILVVHGGSWKHGNKFQLSGYAMRLAARGYATFAINYRLAPKHPYPAQIDDCRSALRWIADHAKEYGVDPNRIGAIGYSAGAHLVLLLGTAGNQRTPQDPIATGSEASSPRLKCVVAGGSPCNLTVLDEDDDVIAEFLGGTRRENPDAYVNASPYFYVTSDDPPVRFFHGTNDDLVTIRGPEIMIKMFGEKGVEADLIRIDGADHITAATNLRAVEQAIEFFDKHLKRDSVAAGS